MQTKNGIKVVELQKLGDNYIGIVKGKLLSWDKQGRRSKVNRSKLDLCIVEQTKVFFINVMANGEQIKLSRKKFKTEGEAKANTKYGYIKTIQIEL